ncbi:MAG TPA: putative toxin-antitoxin system toxin component, PIN family [Promineifilum sp.]
MLRAVLDTNLFVSSALVGEGLPAQAVDAWRAHRFLLIISPAIMAEIAATLRYDRIRRKYDITEDDVSRLLALLSVDAVVVPGQTDVAGSVPDDPDDEAILACAVDGQADAIVSGDRHLLALDSFRGIPILTIRQFMERLAASEEGDDDV